MARKNDPTAHLRHESRAANASGTRYDNDNRRAVVAYLVETGRLPETCLNMTVKIDNNHAGPHFHRVKQGGTSVQRMFISLDRDAGTNRIRWARIRSANYRHRWGDNEAPIMEIEIPHWDYTGQSVIVESLAA